MSLKHPLSILPTKISPTIIFGNRKLSVIRMSTFFERNLNLCFTKLKRHQSPPSSQPTPPSHRRRHSHTVKTFNSLYDIHSDSDDGVATTSAAVASNRFFFSSPGRSNSIIESSSPSTSFTREDGFHSGGLAIQTVSPDPYYDFRKSMQEMVEAREINDARANWDYLHELLTCYLDLNPKNAHKFIVGAFADLFVTLMASSGSGSSLSLVVESDGCRNI